MRFAKDRLTGNIVDAHNAGYSYYICPTCDARVSLRAGSEREPHFAHFPGQGSDGCEDYHPGVYGGEGNITADHGVEDSPDSLGLSVSLNGSNWGLLLRLPEIPAEEFRHSSLGELRGAFVKVYSSDLKVVKLSALDLRPGVGIARVEVQPVLREYHTEAVGRWPHGVTLDRWAAITKGLSAKGTLFRVRGGEWTRLRESAPVDWGESLLLIAVDRCPPPIKVISETAGVTTASELQWRLWRITLPNTPHAEVATWLHQIGHNPRPPIWQICFLSIPIAYSKTEPQYDAELPLIVKLGAPYANAKATVSTTTGTNKHTSTVDASAQSSVHGELTNGTPSPCMIEVLDHGLSCKKFQFVKTDRQEVVDPPHLKVFIGSQMWEAWDTSNSERADRYGDIKVSVGVDGVRIDLVAWLRGGQRHLRTNAKPSDIERDLKDLLPEISQIEIDAGNLGRVTIPVGTKPSILHELEKPSRLTGWMNSVALATNEGARGVSVPIVRKRGGRRRTVSRVPIWMNFLDRVCERKLR